MDSTKNQQRDERLNQASLEPKPGTLEPCELNKTLEPFESWEHLRR
jgi:hypothetical protein